MSTITGPAERIVKNQSQGQDGVGFLARVDRWVTWFMPPAAELRGRERDSARMLIYICLINTPFSLLYAVTSHFIGFDVGAVLMSTGIGFLFVCLFYFRATGRLRMAVHLYMANCTLVAIMGCSFFTGGLVSPVLPWFALVPVMAVLLLGYGRDAFVWFLVCLLIALAYGVATLKGYVFPKLYRPEFETIFGVICILGLISVLLVISLTFDYNSRRAMQQVLDSRKEVDRLAREQERMAERGRILRDMHDGVGAHISSALRQLGGAPASASAQIADEVMQTLRNAMDHLKLSIDSLNLTPGDVTGLLANMRYRLGPRFAGVGVDLQWDVEWLPLCNGLDAAAMGELRFMVLGALSNVLQHSHASVVCVHGHAHRRADSPDATQSGALDVVDHVIVQIVDNGCGFDTQRPLKNGLANLHSRAIAIGAQLKINSAAHGTVVEIRLPI